MPLRRQLQFQHRRAAISASRNTNNAAVCLRAERGLCLLSQKFDHSTITDWSFVVINNLQTGNE
jgi:hypothetical protein